MLNCSTKEMIVLHYLKVKSADVYNLLAHADRGIDSPDVRNHANESIDPTRTALNYDLVDRHGQTAYQIYKGKMDRMKELTLEQTGKALRKDTVCLCSWVVTVPKDLPPNKHEEFFQRTFDWLGKRYGKDNVITAAVHLDETTPHMHFQFLPVVEDKKTGQQKMYGSHIETKRSLGTIHRDLQKALEREMKCPVHILNGATEGGNKSVLQMKCDTLQKEVDTLTEQRDTLLNGMNGLTQAIDKTVQTAKTRTATISRKKDVVEVDKAKWDALTNVAEMISNEMKTAMDVQQQNVAERAQIEQDKLQAQRMYRNAFTKEQNAAKQEQQLQADRENLDQLTRQKAKEQYQQLVQEKQDEISELDEMISEKTKELDFKKQLAENVTANFWGKADYLVKADENQRAFDERVKGGAGRDRNYVQATSNRGR